MKQRLKSLFSFEVVPGQHRPKLVRNGTIFLVLIGFVLVSGYTRHVLFLPKGGELVKAEFQNAWHVRNSTEVRINGVNVGKVEDVERRPGGSSAIVTMRLKDAPKIHRDASAGLWWRTLLGRNFYIQLDPGSPSAPELGDDVIPKSRTTEQVELDYALQPLDGNGRGALRSTIETFDEGLAGPGAGRTIDRFAPSMRPIAPGLEALRGRRPGDLTESVRNANRVVAALGRSERDLGGLIDNGETTLAVTAARRADLTSMLDQAPATLAQTESQMVRLRTTLDKLDRRAVDLRPGVRALAPTVTTTTAALREARPTLAGLRPLLRDLQPAVRRLRTAARSGNPLVERLRPTARRLRTSTVPFLRSPNSTVDRPVYQTIGPFFSSVDSITAINDVYGHQVRFQPGGGGGLFSGMFPCQQVFPEGDPQRQTCEQLRTTLGSIESLGGGLPAPAAAAREGRKER